MPSGKVTYRQRDILLTRFPFSDFVGSKIRPVLVLSNDVYNRRHSDLLICAVTSSPRAHEYAASLATGDLEQGILKVESKVRADAVISIEQRIVIRRIARVAIPKYQQIISLVQKLISVA